MYRVIKPFFHNGQTYFKGVQVSQEIASQFPRNVSRDNMPFKGVSNKTGSVILENNKVKIIKNKK